MTKKPAKTKVKPSPKIKELDLDPDAWPKFEKLLKDAAKKGRERVSKEAGSTPKAKKTT